MLDRIELSRVLESCFDALDLRAAVCLVKEKSIRMGIDGSYDLFESTINALSDSYVEWEEFKRCCRPKSENGGE